MLKLIIINGYPESGKDTFVNFCREFTDVNHVSSVYPAKQALRVLGWDGKEKTPEVRDALSTLKDLSTSLFDGPMQYIKSKIKEYKDYPDNLLMFVDAREPAELKKYRNNLGATIIFIDREPKGLPKNHADNNVKNFQYDFIIDNHGTLEQLKQRASEFVNNILEQGGKEE
jgi:hypothetical protein